jgi:enterochelin esterase-like enzyme
MRARSRAPISLVHVLPMVVALGCATFPERLEYRTVRSPALRNTWSSYGVFLPPEMGEEDLPLAIFLHGGGDGPDCLDRHGIAARLDAGMRAGTIPRAIIVVPEGHLGFWANWYDGTRNYEDWVIDEVMPAVARRFHTRPCPEGCHLLGVSMGAEGAIRIVLHRPGTFSTVAAISGPAMDTERRLGFMRDPLINMLIPTHHVFGPIEPRSRVERDDPYLRWQSPEDLGGMRLFLAWGTRDRDLVREGGEALHAHLEGRGIPHVHQVFEGEHAWTSWAPVIEEALRTNLGAVAPLTVAPSHAVGSSVPVGSAVPAPLPPRAPPTVPPPPTAPPPPR